VRRSLWMQLMRLIVLISFVSCATLVAKAYLPPLPVLEEVPRAEAQSEREAILERNYIKLARWVEIVWKANK
jgi:hypothetical protein